MEFTGIAEVEYKWDERDNEYKLIEINPRPWDQHPLGLACGIDLIHLAYCDRAGLPSPDVRSAFTARKWVAEDAFLLAALGLVWRREAGLGTLLRQARGKRMYAIWSVRDPLPFVMYLATTVPSLIGMALRATRRSQPVDAVDRQEAAVRTAR
jgi:predicted ATP-grasp superfamily ATP-dependent carboligase